MEKFGILTVDQMRKMNVGGFGESGRRNALRVLGEMEAYGLIISKHVGKKLFALPGSRFGFWEHKEILVNYLIWKGYWKECRIEYPLMDGKKEIIRPDAIVGDPKDFTCIEVDRRQSKQANLQKIKIYEEYGIKFKVVCYRSRAGHFPGCVREYIEDIVL